MTFKVNTKGSNTQKKDYGRIADGTYMSRLAQLIDMGEQLQTDYQTGESKKDDNGNDIYKREVMLTFEFPTETIEIDGVEKPRWQSKNYTLSLNEKAALFKVVRALDDKATDKIKKGTYDLSVLVNKPCMVSIGSTSGGNAKITDVVSAPKGFPVPELQNPTKIFSMDSPDMAIFESLLQWQKDKITSARNFNGSALSKLMNTKVAETADESIDEEDESPF